MTEAEAAIQKDLRLLGGDLEAIAGKLATMISFSVLPPSPQERGETDIPDEPDVTSEVRRVIQCVLTDCLRPAIRDLQAAAAYKPDADDGPTGGGVAPSRS